jgi:trk system potassium uptake protein
MHLPIILRFVSILIFFLGLSMAVPLLVSSLYGDGCVRPLLLSGLITSLTGFFLFLLVRKKANEHLSHRDGIAIVTIGWVAAGLFGTLPYLLSGAVPTFTDACFESFSGFTTTGASIFTRIEGLPEGILLWRSLTQWLGGMGIIVLSLAILPFLGVGGMQLYKAEIPSPVVDKLKPRISETAKTLWKVYIFLTLLEITFLAVGGMSLFDALCHSFSTMPTGGFSPRDASIAYYASPFLQWTIIFFMLLAGINFSLHYKFLRGDLGIFVRDPECRVFLLLILLFLVVVTLNTSGDTRDAAFQVTSIITTTGFVTVDYDQWPALTKSILLTCMFLGGMAGSTGGGMKIMRSILLVKHSYREIFRIIHPRAVTAVKLGGRPVQEDVLSSVWGFFILYLALFTLATLLMAALGLDMITSFSSVAASIGNIGPGMGLVGPVSNYAAIPWAGKWILIFCMLLGRLEIYTVILLLVPEYWRK